MRVDSCATIAQNNPRIPGYNVNVRDSAIRCEAGISLRSAARMLGVSDNTLRIYEIDPLAVKDPDKRGKIAKYYDALRAFMQAVAA